MSLRKSFLAPALLMLPLGLIAQPAVVIPDHPVDKVSASVYVIHGTTEIPNAQNQGFINNPGIVMTSKGVVVIDPGGVIEGGEMTLRAIKKLTDKPVVAVFNTHQHADHWFANAAFTNAYPNIPIYAHQTTIDVAQDIGTSWVSTIKNLSKSDHHKKKIQIASHPVKHADVIHIGDTSFTIYHYGVMHTHSDIMIAVNQSEVIFMGDNLYNGRYNPHADGHIKKTWEGVEKALNASKAKVIVPGHGKTGNQAMMRFSLNGYKILYQSVRTQFEEDLSDFEMRPTVEALLGDYKHWQEFDNVLGKLINKAFLEIEEAEF